MAEVSYYVNDNAQNNGDHEVHKAGCEWFAKVVSKMYLGEFDNCADAVAKAKETYLQSNGCYYCSNPCHTG